MDTATIDETTWRYLGQWQRLVSTTNWDKGRIIVTWRKSMEENAAPPAEFTDEAWARQVANVTPQHVGRLRRTWERFGTVADDYAGLYWSHFQAAGDWHDAEMWLEGAVQSNWSVIEMRRQRATTLGTAELETDAADTSVPWDDDAPADDVLAVSSQREAVVQDPAESRSRGTPSSEAGGQDDWSDDGEPHGGDDSWADGSGHEKSRSSAVAEPRQPFAALPSLPADVSDAFEAFKLCILRHKLAGWSEISRGDVLIALDALKELAMATPTE